MRVFRVALVKLQFTNSFHEKVLLWSSFGVFFLVLELFFFIVVIVVTKCFYGHICQTVHMLNMAAGSEEFGYIFRFSFRFFCC